MAFGEMFSSLRSYAALDVWSTTLGGSVAGMAKVGYKANRTTFVGGTARNDLGATTPTGLSVKIGEQNLVAETYIDWSQGSLVTSNGQNHFAIEGNGFFVLMDDRGEFYYTRAGQFEYKNGRIVTPEGLTLVDRSLLLSMGTGILPPNVSTTLGDIRQGGTYNPTITVAEINADDSGWFKAGAGTAGGSLWLPYVGGTKYDEGNGSYQQQAITLKRTFQLDGAVTSASLTIEADDWAWVYVNGHQLTRADVMNAAGAPNQDFGGTPIFNGATQFDIAQYLRNGTNSIQIYGVENQLGNSINTAGSIIMAGGGAIAIENHHVPGDTRWVAKLVGASPASQDSDAVPWHGALLEPPPGEWQEGKMFNLTAKDFIIANIEIRDGLRYSKYGNTIFQAGPEAGQVFLWEAGKGGTGKVHHGRLEASNVDLDNLPAEMKIAQGMYEGIANIFEMRYWMIDTMFQRLVP